MTIVDNAVYVDGHRTADPEGLDETYFAPAAAPGHGLDRAVPA